MKTFKYFAMAAIAVVALVFASCGGSKSNDTSDDTSFDVTVDNTTIGGKLSRYFSLVDKTYKYKEGVIDNVIVELTCIEPLPENLKAYLGVEVLDEDGTVISAGKPDAWSFDDFEVLRQASPGQTITIEIKNHQNIGEGKPAKIRLSSVVEEDDNEEDDNSTSSSYSSASDDDSSLDDDDSSNDDSNTALSSSDSQDWDALLNSYEQYVNKYISYMKKAAKGDMSALSEYPALMEKAQELSEKMENAQGEMSASQWARYTKITNKMTQAAANM